MGQLDEIKRIACVEQSAEIGWPAVESVAAGPWRFRASQGITNRANSVMTTPHGPAESNWPELIDQAVEFYRQRDLPTIFQISPSSAPHDLDQMLAGRGYAIQKRSQVHRAAIADLLRMRGNVDPAFREISRDELDESWLTLEFGPSSARRAVQEQICRQITAPQIFASVRYHGETVACARGVAAEGLGWVYGMVTSPPWQRRGLALRMLNFLAQWSSSNGALQMYLQVMADNAPAIALYRKAGFRLDYLYHYRVKGNK